MGHRYSYIRLVIGQMKDWPDIKLVGYLAPCKKPDTGYPTGSKKVCCCHLFFETSDVRPARYPPNTDFDIRLDIGY